MDKILISRKEAKEQGLKFYYTGKECKYGHLDLRRTDNTACLSCTSRYYKEYYQLNKEVLKEYSKEYVKNNPDVVKAARENWLSDNPDYYINYRKDNLEAYRVYNNQRRARRALAGGSFKQSDIDNLMLVQGAACCVCGKSFEDVGYHIDHIIPIFRGGNSYPENIQLLCPGCNLSKGVKLMSEWLDS